MDSCVVSRGIPVPIRFLHQLIVSPISSQARLLTIVTHIGEIRLMGDWVWFDERKSGWLSHHSVPQFSCFQRRFILENDNCPSVSSKEMFQHCRWYCKREFIGIWQWKEIVWEEDLVPTAHFHYQSKMIGKSSFSLSCSGSDSELNFTIMWWPSH